MRARVRLAVRAGLAPGLLKPMKCLPLSASIIFIRICPKATKLPKTLTPVNGRGEIEITFGPKDKLQKKKIGIHHAHLEEDAAKSSHFADYSLVDFNRAGCPLLEIVSLAGYALGR